MKKLLLIIPLLVLLFSFTSLAHSYTWVNLGDYEDDVIWYDPSTIEIGEGVASALLKIDNGGEHVMLWIVIDCPVKKYYLVGAMLVDENDKALSPPDEDEYSDFIMEGDSPFYHLYQMLCPKSVKDEI